MSRNLSPSSDSPVVVAEQDAIDQYDSVAREFLREIFSLDSSRVLLTDESRISDFFPSGMSLSDEALQHSSYTELLQRWDVWVVERIRQCYGIEAVYAAMPLVTLFGAIEAARAPQVLH